MLSAFLIDQQGSLLHRWAARTQYLFKAERSTGHQSTPCGSRNWPSAQNANNFCSRWYITTSHATHAQNNCKTIQNTQESNSLQYSGWFCTQFELSICCSQPKRSSEPTINMARASSAPGKLGYWAKHNICYNSSLLRTFAFKCVNQAYLPHNCRTWVVWYFKITWHSVINQTVNLTYLQNLHKMTTMFLQLHWWALFCPSSRVISAELCFLWCYYPWSFVSWCLCVLNPLLTSKILWKCWASVLLSCVVFVHHYLHWCLTSRHAHLALILSERHLPLPLALCSLQCFHFSWMNTVQHSVFVLVDKFIDISHPQRHFSSDVHIKHQLATK